MPAKSIVPTLPPKTFETVSAGPPYPFLVANGYTSFHRVGFSMFYLRGKTYGKVLSKNWKVALRKSFTNSHLDKCETVSHFSEDSIGKMPSVSHRR
jgi:hypothetical protein